MYLTRIALDDRRRETMQALASPGILHGAVGRCFGEERESCLWRIDRLHEVTHLLILSRDAPDCTAIAAQFGSPDDTGCTKAYDGFLSQIREGQCLRFRLRANPVRSVSQGSGNGRGKVCAHVTQAQQKQWLMERAEKHGFSLSEDAFDVTDTRWENFPKHAGEKRTVTLRTAAFEGVLTVTDAELFKKTLTGGIGRAKAYGCGLLTVMRA